MLDAMTPEQFLEWVAFYTVDGDTDRPATITDPRDQETALRGMMGF